MTSGDLGFRAPRGTDPDELRRGWERMDGRVRKAFQTQEQLEEGFSTLQNDFKALQEGFDTRMEEFSEEVSNMILAAFTTLDEPGLASVPDTGAGFTTTSLFVVTVNVNDAPLLYRLDNFRQAIVNPQSVSSSVSLPHADNLGIFTPFLSLSAVDVDGTLVPTLSSTRASLKALNANQIAVRDALVNLINKLKTAKVLT